MPYYNRLMLLNKTMKNLNKKFLNPGNVVKLSKKKSVHECIYYQKTKRFYLNQVNILVFFSQAY